MYQCRETDQNVFLGQTAQSGKIVYIFHVVIDGCRLCHNQVCWLLVSACNNQGLHSLVGMDTDLTTRAPGFDSPLPPSQWRRFGIPSGGFFPTKIDVFHRFNEEIGIFIPNHPLTIHHKPVATLWHSLRGFFPHQNGDFLMINQSQMVPARRRALIPGHIPDQSAQEKISAWAYPPCRYL